MGSAAKGGHWDTKKPSHPLTPFPPVLPFHSGMMTIAVDGWESRVESTDDAREYVLH
jgi:hypothetical protein